MAQVIVKFQEQTKSLVLPSQSTYAQLFQNITQTFHLMRSPKILLHYLDNENEAVRLSSDTELAYALTYFSPLTIHVAHTKLKQKRSIADRVQKKKMFQNLTPQQQEDFLDKLSKLSHQGFRSVPINLRYLLENKGDLALTVDMLMNRNKERRQKKVRQFQEKKIDHLPEKRRMVHISKTLTKSFIIPDAATIAYIDGNNLFFSFMKNRRNMRQREEIITEKVVRWVEGKKDRFQKVILTFDRCKHPSTQGKLEVCGPLPRFRTSDDLLVDLAQKNPDKLDSCIFITSDRELIGKLMVIGVKHIMGSGTFVKLLIKELGEKDEVELKKNEDLKEEVLELD